MSSWRCQEQQLAFLQEASSMLPSSSSLGKRSCLWNYHHEESWRCFAVDVTILWCLRLITAVCKTQSRNQWELSLLSSRPPTTLTWGCWAATGSSSLSQETFIAAAKLLCSKILKFSSSLQDQRNHPAAPTHKANVAVGLFHWPWVVKELNSARKTEFGSWYKIRQF